VIGHQLLKLVAGVLAATVGMMQQRIGFAPSPDRHPYLGPRLGYFVIRLLNLSLLKKCDPRIWIVVSLELIGIFQGGGIGRPEVFLLKQKLGSL
jgi:hypothetical protein